MSKTRIDNKDPFCMDVPKLRSLRVLERVFQSLQLNVKIFYKDFQILPVH